jgi:hypothetical protein
MIIELAPIPASATVTDLHAARIERVLRGLATAPSGRFTLVCASEIHYPVKLCRILSLPVKNERSEN